MSERLGSLTYGKPGGGRFMQSAFVVEERNYSERTAELIDDEVQRLISEAHDMSRNILTSRHDQLERIAQELIQKETLDRAELDRLLNEVSQKEATPSTPGNLSF